MLKSDRRGFLKHCAVGSGAFLADPMMVRPLGETSADTSPGDWIQYRSEIDPVVKLIRNTPRETCVEVFADRLKKSLTYQQFLAALFVTASETGDLHQLAQVNAAFRLSQRVSIKEHLLPLFWALDRIKRGQEAEDKSYFLKKLHGPLPSPITARASFSEAMKKRDKSQAERSIVVIAKHEGPYRAMALLWEYAVHDLGGTLGHLPIGVANGWRTLQVIGWQHAEPCLRYLAREVCRKTPDDTYLANVHRCNPSLCQLPADWASQEGHRDITLELYQIIRSGDAESAGEFIKNQLISGSAKAGAIWDAISLGSADLIYRYRTGGSVIGSGLIHAVTSTNAMRYGFRNELGDRLRMIQLLQAAGFVSNSFIKQAMKDDQLRDMNLINDLEDLTASALEGAIDVNDLFSQLPVKSDAYRDNDTIERQASDEACRQTFKFLIKTNQDLTFLRSARSLVCAKATDDPHDLKYPTAVFEDAYLVSSEWRPYVLASTVHALHGPKSPDSAVFLQSKNALSSS